MIFILLALVICAIGLPIAVEARVHPEQNVLIGLRKAAADFAWGTLLLGVASYLLIKASGVILGFLTKHFHVF